MKYIKELDALRALAIMSVIMNHWFPGGSLLNNLSEWVDAPNIFFTISGFLVTKILLNDRLKAEKLALPYYVVYRTFFIKRALRIFPAYYLTILLTYLLIPGSRAPMGYLSCLTFTTNFYIYIHKEWGDMGHLWSMGVEQQFYLLWPLLILLTSRKYLLPAIASMVIVGIVSQRMSPSDDFAHILPYTVLDTLGLGALLAWLITFKPEWLNRVHKILLPVGIVSFLQIICNSVGLGDGYIPLYNRTLVALITISLITYFMMMGTRSSYPFSFLFRNKFLLFIGKISYGIYLYHLVFYIYFWEFLKPISAHLPSFIRSSQYSFIAGGMALLIGIAWLSWKYIELPISDLKRFVTVRPLPLQHTEAV
ncbi:acyltransferase family protein [Spirosoma pulveris]